MWPLTTYYTNTGGENLLSPLMSKGMSERPRRVIKPRALTYWEEFVQTDAWYVKKIIEDVPEDELRAALLDEDFDEDAECG